MSSRAGLTLLELVVVLVILVLIAGTALTASEALVGETRYETTRSELRNIERSLLGSLDTSSSGEASAISFVADIGRLPIARGPSLEAQLSELWLKPDVVTPFAIQSPAGDLEVRLPGGWRGPYVRVPLGLGEQALRDGWGRGYDLLAADGTVAVEGTPIGILRSLGADRQPLGVDYDADVTLVLSSSTLPVVGPRHTGDVPVRVKTTNVPDEVVIVRIYGARDGDIVTLDEWPPAGSPSVPANGADVPLIFQDVPIGPRVVRAYRTTKPPATMDAPFDGAATSSPMHAITVVQGGLAEVEIELP